ncbi:MAG: DNA methyltransferase, partial [Nitrososphaera sp.]
HPARFAKKLPQFFVDFLTDSPNDLVVDIFAGSNVTGAVAEEAGRPWLAFEARQDYLEASKFRFGLPVNPLAAGATSKRTNGVYHINS